MIDTINSDGEDVTWLCNKIESRGIVNQLHYLSPISISGNNYLRDFSLITNLDKLKALCTPSRKKTEATVDDVNKILFESVKNNLSHHDIDFLTQFYFSGNSQLTTRNKKDASRIYFIRKKLSLESSLEFKQLLQMISTVWPEPSSKDRVDINLLDKKTIWEITKMHPPVWG